jgi:putative membrane protein
MRSDRLPIVLLAAVLAALAVSGVGPRDRLTWWLEVAPVLLALPVLVATRRRFPLTPLVYVLVAVHAAVLCLGGHYTYAEVPLGFWAQDLLGLSRNHYDRVGHFMQGFVPALVVRELLLRTSPLRPGRWLAVLGTGVVLSLSAIYELVEWWAALLLGQGADAFLGMQGDPWDTQWDMFMCLVGATLALLLLRGVHDRQLSRLGTGGAREERRAA